MSSHGTVSEGRIVARYTLTCSECGEEWSSSRSDAKHCSKACRGKASYRANKQEIRAKQDAYYAKKPGGRREIEKRRRNKNSGQFIYALTHPAWPGFTKIGKAENPARRLSSYNVGCPERAYRYAACLPVHDAAAAEAAAHRLLRGLQILNTEWYQIHPIDAIGLLKHLQQGSDCNVPTGKSKS